MEVVLVVLILLWFTSIAWMRSEIERERINSDFWRDTAIMYRRTLFPSKLKKIN